MQRRLRQLVVVQMHIALQRLAHILSIGEIMMRLEYIGNAPIETFDPPVGLGRSGFCQAMLDAQRLAQRVKFVIAAGLAPLAGKQPISECFAVVDQHFGDPDWTSLVQGVQKALGTGRAFVGHDARVVASSQHGH